MNFMEAAVALSKYVEDNNPTGLPIYVDPTSEPDPTTDAALANGWIELHYFFGNKGPDGGRLGPSSSYYSADFVLNCTILTPRSKGDGPARTASAQIEDLLLEKTIAGDITVHTTRESIAPLEDDDTHVQVDRIFTCELEDVF